jgi:uroporphyrinogen-III synthase
LVVECPTIKIEALKSTYLTSMSSLNKVGLAVFVSANAVHYCFRQLTKHAIFWPESIQVAAIGPATAKALKHYGVHSVSTPEIPDSEHILTLEIFSSLKNQSVLLVKGEGGRFLIEETLLARGAVVHTVSVYHRALPNISQKWLDALWQDDVVDVILYTSEQSMQHLQTMLGVQAQNWLQRKPSLVISQRLLEIASQRGMHAMISTPEGIITTLFHYFRKDRLDG